MNPTAERIIAHLYSEVRRVAEEVRRDHRTATELDAGEMYGYIMAVEWIRKNILSGQPESLDSKQ